MLKFRLLMATGVLALLVGTTMQADDKKGESKADALFQELVKKYREAKGDEAEQEVLKTYAGKLLDLAGKDAKSADAPKALFYVLQLPLQGNDTSKAKAVGILIKDHAKNPKLGKQIKQVPAGPGSLEGLEFLKAVAKENPDKTSQAYACKGIIKAQEQLVKVAGRLKDNEDFRTKVEKQLGKEAVKKMLAAAENGEKEIKVYQDRLNGDLKGILLNLSVGAKAPEVESRNLDGKTVKLSDLQGKVVVLDIWATWCGPCRAMIPHTRKLVKKMDGKPFVFVSISADAKKDTVVEFMKDNPMPWTHWWNGATGGIVENWEVEYYPTIYVLDHKGVIRHKDLRNEELDKAVEALVKEAEAEKKIKTE